MAVKLTSSTLEVSVLPQVGAKITDLVHRPTGFNFLWRNPRIEPRPYPVDGNFDNYWCGGWDDGFPTCEPCEYKGDQYPGLGELRALEWKIESFNNDGFDQHVSLSVFGPINPVHVRKTLRLEGESLHYYFSVENIGPLALDFIWGTHPAFQISPGARIHIPARLGIVGQATDDSLGAPGEHYEWPHLKVGERSTDMSRVLLPETGVAAGHYATELSAGWFAVENPAQGVGIFVEFPVEHCPYVWMWLCYGGWRGYYVAVVEPWTSFPVTLSEAVAHKTHRTLAPGKAFCVNLRATPWASPESLSDILARSSQQAIAHTSTGIETSKWPGRLRLER